MHRLLVLCCVLPLVFAWTFAMSDQQQEFISAMQRIDDERLLERHNRGMQERLLKVARKVTNEGRELSNSYSSYSSNNNYNNNNNGNNNQYNGVNEYANKYYSNQNSQSYYYEPIDLSEYAFKYVGCQNIATWNDYRAYSGQTPTTLRRHVTFRLCEANSCSTYNKFGCNNNYGEYVIPMEDYLDIMTTYHYKQYSRYCQTCEACSSFDYTLYLNQVAAYQSYVNQMKKRNQYNSNSNSYYNNKYSTNNDDDAATDDAATDDAATDDANSNSTADDYYYNYEQDDDGSGSYDDALGYAYGDYGYSFYEDASNTYSGTDDDTSNQVGDDFWNQYVWHYGGADDDGSRRLSYSSSSYSSNNGANVYSKNFGRYENGGYYGGNVPAPKLPWYIGTDGSCKFKSACQNSKSACRSFHANATNYMPYFSCKAFQMGNAVSYVGPHCRSDGHTIGIALYKDQYCSTYVGDVSDIEKYTGKKFDDSDMSLFFDKSCISCKASESFALSTTSSSSSSSSSSSGAQDTYPFCTVAYESSAKCNQNFKSSNALYEDDENQKNKVCPFIESLVENNYNERGQIAVKESYHFSKWNSGAEYIILAQKASPTQLFWLVAAMGTALGLLIYSVYLYKKLMYRMPWRPPKNVHSPTSGGQSVAGDYDFDTRVEAGRISRINSGITALRSVSQSYDGHSVAAFSQLPAGALSGPNAHADQGIIHGDFTYNQRSPAGVDDSSLPPGEFA